MLRTISTFPLFHPKNKSCKNSNALGNWKIHFEKVNTDRNDVDDVVKEIEDLLLF